jgi:uncharacterized cupredoxin-like copper-binding protein
VGVTHRLVLLALAVAALAAFAVPALAKGTVKEKLTNFKITGAKSTAHGKTTFKASNPANFPHELVVIRTKTKAGKLKTNSAGKANEKGIVGRVKVAPGKSGSLTVGLKKGHYALICNLPGHYKAGMHTDFTVK